MWYVVVLTVISIAVAARVLYHYMRNPYYYYLL